MSFRPRFSGFTRWDDHTRDEESAEPDVDLLPYDETDPGYLERRREAELRHCREQLALDERRGDQAAAGLWRRLIAAHEISEHWASGAGDRLLF